MTSLLIIPRPFLSSAARRAAFGLLVLASLGGCGAPSAGVKDNAAGGDIQSLIDQRVAAIQADLTAKFEAQVALLNDRSSTQIETSGGNAVVDKRLATVDVEALVNARVDAALAKFGTGDTTQNVKADQKASAQGEGASADTSTATADNDQVGAVNTAITVAGGGIGGIVVLGLWLRYTRLSNAATDAEETKRHEQIIDGMKCAFHGQHDNDTPEDNTA